MKRNEALKLRAAMIAAAPGLTDQTASEAPAMFPRLKNDGTLIPYGTRINWNGTIKRAAADLWDTEDNNPDNAPTLWADIGYHDGVRIIPDVITAALAFANGELGYRNGAVYKSLMDGNVHLPENAPAQWEKIE